MASKAHIRRLRQGPESWNAWRESHDVRPDLRDWDFEQTHPPKERLQFHGSFDGFNFAGSDLHGISARNLTFCDCNFDGCAIDVADLCFSGFFGCSFVGATLRVTRIGSASFVNCDFTDADLGYCTAEETSFAGSRLHGCSLKHMSLVKVDFSRADLRAVQVYGISAWDLKLSRTRQQDIVVGRESDSQITVDNIELAQFIHLLIRNRRIRSVIDTITSKVVLLLGRFSPRRKPVLDALRRFLRAQDYVPVLFDFAGPKNRDLTETIRTLGHLARFVIVDLTDPKSVPHELYQLVPFLPSVPVQPIIAEGQEPFAMFEHHQRYPWVLPLCRYRPGDVRPTALRAISACERRLRAGDR